MTGLRATTMAAASAAHNNINHLRARMIPDLRKALSTLMSKVKGLHGHLMSPDRILASKTQTLVDSTPRTHNNDIPDTACSVAPANTSPPLSPATPPVMPPTPAPNAKPADMVPQTTHRSDHLECHNSPNQCFDNPAGPYRDDRFCEGVTPLAGLNTAAQYESSSVMYGSFCPLGVTTEDGGSLFT